MNRQEVLLEYLTAAATGSMLGILAITLFVYFTVTGFSLGVNPIQSIGLIFVDNKGQAKYVGILIHIAAGFVFGLLYTLILQSTEPESLLSYVGLGAAVGLGHGFVLSFMLIPLLAEHHTSKRVRSYGMFLAFLIGAAHIIYGACLGLAVGAFSVGW